MAAIEPAELKITVSIEDDIVVARQKAREFAKSIGLGVVDQSRVATAVSELTRNVIRYATDGRGEVYIRHLGSSTRSGIEIVVADQGPGISDIDQALIERFTSSRGMGLGLSGTRRLMDSMEIDSVVGHGTTVTIRKWRR